MTTNENARPAGESAEAIVKSLLEIGTTWARYGLNIGQQALETSAKTLQNTAKVLHEVSQSFEEKKPADSAQPTAESTNTVQ